MPNDSVSAPQLRSFLWWCIHARSPYIDWSEWDFGIMYQMRSWGYIFPSDLSNSHLDYKKRETLMKMRTVE